MNSRQEERMSSVSLSLSFLHFLSVVEKKVFCTFNVYSFNLEQLLYQGVCFLFRSFSFACRNQWQGSQWICRAQPIAGETGSGRGTLESTESDPLLHDRLDRCRNHSAPHLSQHCVPSLEAPEQLRPARFQHRSQRLGRGRRQHGRLWDQRPRRQEEAQNTRHIPRRRPGSCTAAATLSERAGARLFESAERAIALLDAIIRHGN